ncbi:MAG TPA: SpoIIE family protein phosphatase [Mycobacteriales bacterium]|nr:SpoIIE family protein phosphatase [Mycobacteriales bacterium]
MSAFDSEVARLRSTVASLEQLIEVLEATALEESARRDSILGELSLRSSQLRGLAAASIDVNSASSTAEILDVVTAAAARVIGAHQAVASMTIDFKWAQAITSVHLSDAYAAWHDYGTPPDGSGIYHLVCERNEPMRLRQDELEAHPAWRGFGEHAAEHPPMNGWLAAPLVAPDGSNMGLVQLSDKVVGDFTDNDEAVLVQLAQVAAIALQNTREFEREHDIAETLQRSLLPEHLSAPPGTAIVTRYFPGSRGTRVGGDWYDVLPLDGGRVAVVLGDVVGHGLRAAATMGQLRAALRAYAVVDSAPLAVLARLEHLLAVAGDTIEGYVATLFYGVVDPAAQEVHYVSAGHPAPVLLSAAGETQLLDGALTGPLGLGGPGPKAHGVVTMPTGSVLLMYSDGLIERRGESLDDGLNRLLKACTAGPADLDGLCDHVVATMSEAGASDDDVALLALGLTGASTVASWNLPAVPSSVGRARRAVAELVRGAGRHDLVEAAELVVSELVTNAVRHAGTDMCVGVRLDPSSAVRISVRDEGPPDWQPTPGGLPTPAAEGGRGLLIVAALAHSWGVDPDQGGKIVWCELSSESAVSEPEPA